MGTNKLEYCVVFMPENIFMKSMPTSVMYKVRLFQSEKRAIDFIAQNAKKYPVLYRMHGKIKFNGEKRG